MSDNADDGPGYNLSARILTTSILSLTFVVLLLLVLHLYARCIVNRSITGNNPQAQISLFRVTSDPPIAPQTPNGLNQSTIDSLPMFPYRKKDENMAECTICLSSVDDEEMVRVLPKCKHLFHVGCIDMWLHSHSTCPVCRARVEPVYSSCEFGLVSRVGSSLRRLMSRDRSGRRIPVRAWGMGSWSVFCVVTESIRHNLNPMQRAPDPRSNLVVGEAEKKNNS